MTTTVPESFETLKMQVAFLEFGTNPIVFFPPDTDMIPKLPQGMKSAIRKEGVYYYNPKFLKEDLIDKAVADDKMWFLLGFVQKNSEAIKGKPVSISVRNLNGKEIKTAVVDSNSPELLAMQAYIFGQWFPDMPIFTETVFETIAGRLVDMGVLDA